MTAAIFAVLLALQVTLREPSWSTGEISVDARLLVMAEIVPAESLQDVWVELRGRGRDWERRDIPPAHQLRLSARSSVVAMALSPRGMAWLQPGDEFELRLRALYRNGEIRGSDALVVRVAEPERREAGLLDRLTACEHHLEGLLLGLEEDHRRLSRVEHSADGENFDVVLEAMEVRWRGRLQALHQASDTFLSILDEAVTDRLVNPAREARYRKTLACLRACGSETGIADTLVRARRAGSREVLRAALNAEDRFIGKFQRILAEVSAWRGTLDLRREVRSLLQSQKSLNGEVERQRDRER